jgi:hypothetical protein
MHDHATSFTWRLWITVVADLAIVALHLPALARARVSHTYYWYGHPWHDMSIDFFLFLFLAVALVAGAPVVTRGSYIQRATAIVSLPIPVGVLATFII